MLQLESTSRSTSTSISNAYVCQNPKCRRRVRLISSTSHVSAANPRCVCGAVLKKAYAEPQLTVLTKSEGMARMARASKAYNDCAIKSFT